MKSEGAALRNGYSGSQDGVPEKEYFLRAHKTEKGHQLETQSQLTLSSNKTCDQSNQEVAVSGEVYLLGMYFLRMASSLRRVKLGAVARLVMTANLSALWASDLGGLAAMRFIASMTTWHEGRWRLCQKKKGKKKRYQYQV
jgi:hypothetical protein